MGRLVHDGRADWLATAEADVLVGVLLQVPCGLFAIWLVRGPRRWPSGFTYQMGRPG